MANENKHSFFLRFKHGMGTKETPPTLRFKHFRLYKKNRHVKPIYSWIGMRLWQRGLGVAMKNKTYDFKKSIKHT